MCGIFGFMSKNGRGPDLDLLREIAAVTETRGRHAFGLIWQTADGGLGTFKRPGAATDGLDDLGMADDAVIVAGHCRWATHGTPDDNRNNHPHASGNGYIVHNGVVLNHEELADQFRLPRTSECDTEVLARMIAKRPGGVLLRSAWAAERAEGKLAMLGVWTNRLVLVRNGNPLHFGEAEEGWYFASLATGLPGAKSLKNGHACLMARNEGRIKISSTDLQPRLAI